MKLMIKLTTLIRIEHIIAHPKLSISKPFMVREVTHNIKPLMTKVNKPRVKRFNGRVSSINRGRMTAFITPRKIDPTIAAQMVRLNAGMMAAVITIANMLNSHLKVQP
jgi:hypothetical protein